MERTLTAFSAIILLIGCCTGCGRNKTITKSKMPDIVFMYCQSSEDSFVSKFCDKNGNCYAIISKDVKNMDINELNRSFAQGRLGKDIKLIKSGDRDEVEKAYTKFDAASKQDNIGLIQPTEVPSVEAPSMAWYGICSNENDKLEKVCIHENKCMTDVYSGNNDINDVYDWLSDKL
ncbi:MAG: hypothetical protein K5898_16110 [Ruminococcus sp.]|uniref:hypothetical protein n=1 Tax=Ruminococcus sp. TaxID=41978 RepID=UPI0025D90E73|nr:hypothetical protein [Ruminococcus sp.]MCR4796664.1 hypothetical protein [Ruminococcus sp.]